MVASILLVLLIRCCPETITSPHSSEIPLSSISDTPSSRSILIFDRFDKKPGFADRATSETQSIAFLYKDQGISTSEKFMFSLAFIFLSIAIGFLIGKQQKRLSESQLNTCQELECSSQASTSDSPFQSPISLANACEPCNVFPLLSLLSIDSIIDPGNFKKKFTNIDFMSEEKGVCIYRAQHKLDSQLYIVKVMKINVNFMENGHEKTIFREINRVKQLKCRHITRYVTCWVELQDQVSIYDTTEVLLHVQMEYIQGQSLRQWLDQDFNETKCIYFLSKISKVMKFIHSKELAHGNITLDNIYVDKYNWLTIGDFDFSNTIQDDITSFSNLTLGMLGRVPKHSLPNVMTHIRSLDHSHSLCV